MLGYARRIAVVMRLTRLAPRDETMTAQTGPTTMTARKKIATKERPNSEVIVFIDIFYFQDFYALLPGHALCAGTGARTGTGTIFHGNKHFS